MQLHTLHHIHDGAAAIKAACAYICAFVDPQYRRTRPHTHTHARIGVGLYKEPGVTRHFALFLIGNYRSSVTTISLKIE